MLRHINEQKLKLILDLNETTIDLPEFYAVFNSHR
jgi:hypothetical protein